MKKTLAILLAFVMVIGMIPMSVFAAGTGENLTITFETDFSNNLVIGDTFTVTAKLANNASFGTMTLSLKWNKETVAFNGFNASDRGGLVSEVFPGGDYAKPEINQEDGIIVATDTYGYDTNGVIFTANFSIVGDGALGIGLKTDTASEFQIKNVGGSEDIPAAINLSAVQGLTVGGKVVGAPVPDKLVTAGVAAMITDEGAVLGYECLDDYLDENFAIDGGNGTSPNAPVYLVKIPAGAEEVYVQYSVPLECNLVGEEKWPSTTYGLVEEEVYEGERILSSIGDATKGTVGMSCVPYRDQNSNEVTIPLVMEMKEWGQPTGKYFAVLRTEDENYAQFGCKLDEYGLYQYYVVGNQILTGDKPIIAYFVFEYGAASEGDDAEPTYKITVEKPTGGTVRTNKNVAAEGEDVTVSYEPDYGYRFKHFLVNGEPDYDLAMNNFILRMPPKDVVISAVFELIPPTTYDVNVNTAQYGTVSADKPKAAAGDQVTLTVNPAEGYELDTLTVKQGETEIDVSNNAFTMPAGTVTVSATFKKVVAGYRFATSADVSAVNGGTAVVHVKITGHSDPQINYYNAYDITLIFDNTKLQLATDEYNNFIYDGAVKKDGGSVTVDGNKIRIIGCGATKYFAPAEGQLKADELAALTFKVIGEGDANVTIDKVQVSDKQESVKEDAPVAIPKRDEDDTGADETPDVSVIVVPYSVSKPGFISGNDKVPHGATYTFSYSDTKNYTYDDLTVKVGGTAVENLTPDENGVYTIAGVTGAIEITAIQTPNSYKVGKPQNVTGPEMAIYGEDYIFTVTPSAEDMAIDTVTVTYADGSEVPYTINEQGEYVIAGADITGVFTITVTEKEKMTTVTFSGIEATEIEGGLTQSAEIGKAFTFKLNKVEGFKYTAKVGETDLAETAATETAPAFFTIPANLVVKEGVQVVITKEDNTKPVVDVTEYINLDGKTMFLVTAKWRDRVLAYGEDTMFWSDKYTVTGETEAGANCWLVVSTEDMNSVELVKAAAEAAIKKAAEGTTATNVKYNCDINGTTKVDVNDAQLAYDMYNASYMAFNNNLPMLKFLEADMETDAKLDTMDVAAIINYIVSQQPNENN